MARIRDDAYVSFRPVNTSSVNGH